MNRIKTDWTKPQKLSLVALLFIIGKTIKESWVLILYFIVRAFVKENEDEDDTEKRSDKLIYFLLLTAVFLIFFQIQKFIQFFKTRIYIKDNELIEQTGIFTKKTKTIPIQKIQSVHLIQNYLHRFTNTCTMKIETAGSEKTELEFSAIDFQKAQDLQDMLVEKEAIAAPKVLNDIGTQIMGLRNIDLIKLAISENHIRTLSLIFAFAMSRLDDLRQFFGKKTDAIIDEQVNQINFTASMVAGMIGLGIAITLAFSVIRVLLRYNDMQLTANQKGFQVKWGFLQTQQKMMLQSKVQLISWNSNFVRKLLGIKILRFFMVGENILKDDQYIKLPVLQEDILKRLSAYYQPAWPSLSENPNYTHPSYAWRVSMIYIFPLSLIASVALYFWKPWVFIFPVLVFLYFLITNYIRRKKFIFWHNQTTLQIQKGVWGEEHILLNFKKVQHVALETSPFLRRKNLATLVLHTAGDSIKLPYIPLTKAQAIADRCLYEIELYKS